MKSVWVAVWMVTAASTAVSGVAGAQEMAPPTPTVAARYQTEAPVSGEVGAAVLVLGDGGLADNLIVGTTALGGIEVYGPDGRRKGTVPGGEAIGLDVAYGVQLDGRPTTIVAAVDSQGFTLKLFALRDGALADVGARPIPIGFAAENICLMHNRLDGATYAFIVGDGGEIDQQLIYDSGAGKLDARQVRRINVPTTLKQCVVDSVSAQLYVSEETVGIWRFSADPESYAGPVLIDTPRFGKLTEEVGGLALYDGGAGAQWLIASDASVGRINVYDRSQDDRYVGSLTIAPVAPSAEAIGEPGALFAASQAAGPDLPGGVLLVGDENGPDFKLVSFQDIAMALKLKPGAPQDPRIFSDSTVAAVTATVETAAVTNFGDAADDPAIWAHPTDAMASLVVATDKKGGLYVYDMQGKTLQFLADGKMNNVDVRDGLRLGGENVTIVAASDRTNKAIALYRLDHATRQLVNIADGMQPTGLHDPYGLCLYRNGASGKIYVFVNGDETRKRQWELVDAGNGRVKTKWVRDLTFSSQTEGCVADDETGVLYVGEEDVGLWRMSARANGGTTMATVQRIADNPAVKDDFEGVGLYDLGNGRGYIIVSSQGNDTYAVYRREGAQEYLGSFAVVADPVLGIDGISETDGLDVTSRNLGPGFEHGALVAQDGRNVMPTENQNYKYVPWESIAKALKLEMR